MWRAIFPQVRQAARPAVFSTPQELEKKLLRALSKGSEDRGDEPNVDAPLGDTELQRMLSIRLKQCWPTWRGKAQLAAARVYRESAAIAAGPKGMPCDLYRVAVEDEPLKVLTRLGEFVASGAQAGPMALAFLSDPILKDIVFQIGLVAAERYVRLKKDKDQRSLGADEILAGEDERMNCILAAASFGFGIQLDPGRRFPRNFARFPAAELGHENPRDAIALELYAQAQRMKGVALPTDAKVDDDLDEDILIAELEDIRSLYGCGLVAADHHQGPLRDTDLRQAIMKDLGVPTVLFGPSKQKPSEDARWLLNNLKRVIGPVLDAALGPLSPEHQQDAENAPLPNQANDP